MKWIIEPDRPVYIQLVEQIKSKIVSGEYAAGQRIPAVRELAAEASVNPNTMQKALSELERLGLMYSQRTSGRFITEDKTLITNLKQEIAKAQMEVFVANMKAIGFSKNEIADLFKDIMKEDM